MDEDAGASPAASPRHCCMTSPVSADVLAAREVSRRDALGEVGACRSGCEDLD
ncbi:hypothetical protein E4U53_002320, partial [Claviceps sorghi]